MAIQALPQNAVESWKNLLNLSDEIWYYAGDRSVDVCCFELCDISVNCCSNIYILTYQFLNEK